MSNYSKKTVQFSGLWKTGTLLLWGIVHLCMDNRDPSGNDRDVNKDALCSDCWPSTKSRIFFLNLLKKDCCKEVTNWTLHVGCEII